jgi:putative membrane protein
LRDRRLALASLIAGSPHLAAKFLKRIAIMGIQKRIEVSRYFLVAIITVAIGGCSTSRQQPPANANVAASSPAAQPAQPAQAKAAATPEVPSPEVSSKSTSAAILEQIHQADLQEIAIGNIAQGKASSDEVRAYADQLVKDHTSADQMVIETAQKKGARLHGPGRRAGDREKFAEQKLSSASGAQFDRLFLEQTSAEHKKLISELTQEREDASDDDVEALIDKIVPILQQHQDLAQILMKKEQA